jgi:5-methylcytosine-specific restriction endonuclease McrA
MEKILGLNTDLQMDWKTLSGKAKCKKCGKIRNIRYDTVSRIKNGRAKNLCRKCGQRGKNCHTKERIKYLKNGLFGDNNPNWRGGKARLKDHIRTLAKYRQWRCDVFERDGFTCVICGDKKGGNLEADHIKSFSDIISEYEIENTEQAVGCDELWNINNGRTVCKDCHKKTENYGGKKK